MAIQQTVPAAAHETLRVHPGAIYLDVRTEAEFAAGHPAGARNVPVFLLDPATRKPAPNPDFLRVVERVLARTTKLLVGCQSGTRSQHACELLVQAGYADVANVQGGFGGSADVPGWRDAGLPVETGPAPGRGYTDLKGTP